MSKRLILNTLIVIVSLGLYSQRSTMELTFTAIDSATYVQLDSIQVMNRTQGGDTVLYWPDTVLSIYNVGIHEISKEKHAFGVFQNFPNPVTDQTTISLFVPEKDRVCLVVTDVLGRMIIQSDRVMDHGMHTYRFIPGRGNLYFFTAQWQGQTSNIKILNLSCDGNVCTLEYLGGELLVPTLKVTEDVQEFLYSPGDALLYIGYANGLQSGLPDVPEESSAYTIQFATNIPCPGTPSVEYQGQVYNTIQVFSQCWLKENLNVGSMIYGGSNQTNNGMIEKYCAENDSNNCSTYGGLYQWDEMMQYSTLPVTQGICPPGWHIPTDEEWKILEGAADSLYGIGGPEWDLAGGRGWDAGINLKTTYGWNEDDGTDLYGISMLPGGYRKYDATFHGAGYNACLWSSTLDISNIPWRRRINWGDRNIYRNENSFRQYGFSVRCLRD